MQDTTVEGDEVGSTPSNIPVNRGDSCSKEATAKRGYERSVKYCQKCIDRDAFQETEREKTLVRANLQTVRKFEKTTQVFT